MIAAGSRLDDVTSDFLNAVRDDQRLIHIYRDFDGFEPDFAPDIAIAAHTGEALAALAREVAPAAPDRLAWRDRAHAAEIAVARPPEDAIGPVDLGLVIRDVADRVPADAIIVTDAGNFSTWVHRHYPFRRPRSQASPVSGAMGYGVPGAIGAQLARPGATVVTFVGDGGFMMTGQEMATALQERLPIKIILCDNSAYGTILMHQHRRIGPGLYHGVNLENPDFVALAEAYGAPAWRVTETARFGPAFDSALAHDGPALIHLITDIRDLSASVKIED